MGFLSFMAGKRTPFDAAAAEARVHALQSVLPPGAEIMLMEPSKGSSLEYLIELVGERSHTRPMLRSIVDIVSTTQERWSVSLAVHDTADDRSTYSAVELPDVQVEFVDVLLRAHDELHGVLPSLTIALDAGDGSVVIGDVPRGRAVAAARAAVRAWEGMLHASEGRWRDSTLSVDVGVDIGPEGDRAEIVYRTTVERESDPTDSNTISDEDWTQRVFAAWDDHLPLLEAMLRLPVPVDHEAQLSFTASGLKPRLSVSHHETYESDEAAADELVATIRAQVPGTTLTAG